METALRFYLTPGRMAIINNYVHGTWWSMSLTPVLLKQQRVDLCASEASQVYTASSRTSRATVRPCPKNNFLSRTEKLNDSKCKWQCEERRTVSPVGGSAKWSRALLWVSLKVSTILLLDIEPTSPISCSILKMFVHLYSLLLQPQHLGTGISEDSQELIIGNGI